MGGGGFSDVIECTLNSDSAASGEYHAAVRPWKGEDHGCEACIPVSCPMA
jgi:hypothetical protein